MNYKPMCFVIGPIGEAGSETRRDADDLLELIITPALDIYDFEIIRGDHRAEANQIDVDVIKCVQEAELCIADISVSNANVFYEVGRRDETGKPLILLRSKDAETMPIDIATRRYIEYDLDSRRGIGDARQQLRNFVQPIVDASFEGRSGSSLSDLATILQRVERKLDRLSENAPARRGADATITSLPNGADPREAFTLASRQKNIPLMEQCMDILELRMDEWKFMDQIVEVAAATGSIKAGERMIREASRVIDETSLSFRKKIDFLGSLVSFLNRTDREKEQLELIDSLCLSLEQMADGQPPEDVSQIYNQKNRLYYGVYCTGGGEQWLRKAIAALETAISYMPKAVHLQYNLATCLFRLEGSMEQACEYIDKVIAMDIESKTSHAGHLELACKIHRALSSPRFDEYLEMLRKVDSVKAALLETN